MNILVACCINIFSHYRNRHLDKPFFDYFFISVALCLVIYQIDINLKFHNQVCGMKIHLFVLEKYFYIRIPYVVTHSMIYDNS